MTRHAITGMWTAMLLALLLQACGRSDLITEEVRSLERSLVEAGANLAASSPLTRSTFAAEASWELYTRLDWREYLVDLRGVLPPEYVAEALGEETGSFVRRLDADTLRLELEVHEQAQPLHFRARFLARPW